MKRSKKRILVLMLLNAFLFANICFGQEIPKPDETIEKSNYNKYAHLFPVEFIPAITDGFGGIIKPITIKVQATKPSYLSKAFIALSQKNKGKYTLDADGDVIGLDRNGWPFPDLDEKDKDFVLKLMWNFDNNYIRDEYIGKAISYEKRKGEKMKVAETIANCLYYSNRICVDPKPGLSNPLGLYYSIIMRYTAPATMRDSAMLNYRYVNVKEKDASFLYLPAMRRVLRADSGQRSTPMGGGMVSPDDTNGFGGRTPEFTYRLIGEQKILGVSDSELNEFKARAARGINKLPISSVWEVKDVYVVEITPKDPKYPQSKKIVYMDQTNLVVYYAIAFDKAGNCWKIFMNEFQKIYPFPGKTDDTHLYLAGTLSLDIQFGMAGFLFLDPKGNQQNFTYDQFTPATMLRHGR